MNTPTCRLPIPYRAPQGLRHRQPSQGPPLEGSSVLRKSSHSPTSGSQLAVADTSLSRTCTHQPSLPPTAGLWSHR